MRMRRRVVLLILLALSLMSAACSASGDDIPDGCVDWQGMSSEYHNAASSFPYSLPDGIAFPPVVLADATDEYFAVGYGKLMAYEFAECAYYSVVVANESTNFDAAMVALDSAEEITSSPFYQANVIVVGASWQSFIDKVRLGDFSEFNEYYNNTCTGPWMGLK